MPLLGLASGPFWWISSAVLDCPGAGAELDCIPFSSTRCRVNYHCNFGFAKGWRGAIRRTIMRRKLDVGPVDSLSRLKRAAEQRYTK
jgi:hypothetical protein